MERGGGPRGTADTLPNSSVQRAACIVHKKKSAAVEPSSAPEPLPSYSAKWRQGKGTKARSAHSRSKTHTLWLLTGYFGGFGGVTEQAQEGTQAKKKSGLASTSTEPVALVGYPSATWSGAWTATQQPGSGLVPYLNRTALKEGTGLYAALAQVPVPCRWPRVGTNAECPPSPSPLPSPRLAGVSDNPVRACKDQSLQTIQIRDRLYTVFVFWDYYCIAVCHQVSAHVVMAGQF